jgi:hypothetical protein
LWLNLLVDEPRKQNVEILCRIFWFKPAGNRDSVNKVPQAEVFDPEIEQVLLNAGIFSIDDCLRKHVHNVVGEFECFLQANKLIFQPHQSFQAICLLVLLLLVLVPLGCHLQEKQKDLLFLILRDIDGPALLVFNELFHLKESLLKVSRNQMNDLLVPWKLRLLLFMETWLLL